MTSQFIQATISSVKIGNDYERTTTAEIDGANQIVWITHFAKDGEDLETTRIPMNFAELRQLQSIINNN